MVAFVEVAKKGRLETLSLEIGPGAVALVGPNGAGKSTLLGLAAGRLAPSRGRVLLSGHPARSVAASRRRAYVPQQIAWPRHLRVGEVLEVARRMRGQTPETARAAAERMGLAGVLGRAVGELSGGMRQRLALAAGVMGEPQVWLLDEPASALDPGGFARLVEWVADHRTRGGCVLVSAHRPEEVEALAGEVLLLAHGRLRARGPVASFYRYRLEDGRDLEEVLPGARVVREPVDALREVLYEEGSS
ncbi:MAG TPA: ABC transporter ATP-binding protein [Oceanithermus profundus]|uniref:ABC transporter ATP-binding protein n=1 Tax=Oceanithermus profundus TaxID=187137 RepID=A0A7C4Z635_9DEIN|nr:ABC transporter ATP-binding protein [Oceanithermus profundus]